MSRWSASGRRIPTTLFELAAYRHSLAARCRQCGHEAVFNGAALWWLFQRKHWPDHLDQVPGRLRCTICGGRDIVTRTSEEAPTLTHLEMPTDYAWKKAAARYRS